MKKSNINIPNILTTIRVFLVPIILVLLITDYYLDDPKFSRIAW
ncbi:Uncharacterised protein, partial [Mycoplasma putrefaciens]